MGTEDRAPLPRYGEASLADVVPSLLSALDVPGFANPLGIEPARRVCLLVIDGLGFEELDATREQALFLTTVATTLRPITTCFPATTVASLGSLGTGKLPGEHGLVGTTVAVHLHVALPYKSTDPRMTPTVRAVQGQTRPAEPAPSSGTTAIFTGGSPEDFT